MPSETQKSISAWAVQTFGEAGTNLSCASRAFDEMDELFLALSNDDTNHKASEEIADVFICLYRLAERLGVDIHEEVDKKMAINRARKWVVKDGHGQHVREG